MLDFSKDYILENDTVRLSPLRKEHIKELSVQSNDSFIWNYLIEEGKSFLQLQKYIYHALDNRKAAKEYPFVVYDKTKKAFAGTTRLYDYSEQLKVIKLGHTWYGKDFRGTMVNKNSKYLLLEFIFENLNLERVGFGVHEENKISIAALQSLGCTREGVLRNFIPSLDGEGRTDIVLFSILKSEWLTFIKTELRNKLHIKA
ncbi:GNAT family N-acetyltransferase [Aquimarina litoralis]|uniref:GNAT family N-acetyltransferase n=1 Tax=Aquimarina litoralis TaxID=584605 RepID=UPI001C58EC0C|nr:GNAT family protein [Aquimarina litoralis]MBW1294182.1 GNAT family N-acetyltransferase [Aquimarina litoralis]